MAPEPPTKLVTIGDPDMLDGLEARMKARFAGRLYISKSLPYFLEFASPEVTKGSGLAFVAEQLGFAPERTVAFGDGENDVELLEWAGFGVAVANAHGARPRGCRLGLPLGRGRGRGPGDGSASRLTRMIDIRAARAEPDAYRAALARKGAAEEFDALMEADRAWLALVPQVGRAPREDEAQGQADARADRGAARASRPSSSRSRRQLAAAEQRRAELLDRVPSPPDPSAPDGFTDEDAVELRARRRAAVVRVRAARPPGAGADRHRARREGLGLALRLPRRRRRAASSSRSTASRSTA